MAKVALQLETELSTVMCRYWPQLPSIGTIRVRSLRVFPRLTACLEGDDDRLHC